MASVPVANSVLEYEEKPCGEPEQPGLFCDSPCGFGVGVCTLGSSQALSGRAEPMQGAGCPTQHSLLPQTGPGLSRPPQTHGKVLVCQEKCSLEQVRHGHTRLF